MWCDDDDDDDDDESFISEQGPSFVHEPITHTALLLL